MQLRCDYVAGHQVYFDMKDRKNSLRLCCPFCFRLTASVRERGCEEGRAGDVTAVVMFACGVCHNDSHSKEEGMAKDLFHDRFEVPRGVPGATGWEPKSVAEDGEKGSFSGGVARFGPPGGSGETALGAALRKAGVVKDG